MAEAAGHNREFTRITAMLEADVVCGGRTISGLTRDVSVKGMLLACAEQLAAGSECHCTIYLDGRHGQARVNAVAVVARALPAAIALEFREILDPESLVYLQNLVLYNAADPRQVEEEFDRHLGLKPKVKLP
jgi:hypothetical protein